MNQFAALAAAIIVAVGLVVGGYFIATGMKAQAKAERCKSVAVDQIFGGQELETPKGC